MAGRIYPNAERRPPTSVDSQSSDFKRYGGGAFDRGKGTPITRKRGRRLKTTGNFLVRSAPLFARAGFVAVIADAPSDESGGMDDHFRSSKAHHADIRGAVDFLVSEGVSRVFLVGTSRGTVSAAYLASVMTHPNVKGLRPHRECGDDNL